MSRPNEPVNYKLRSDLICYALIAPTIIMLAIFNYIPIIWAFTKSLFQFEVGGESNFVGLANYVEYLTKDPTTYPSLLNMLTLVVIMVATQLTFPLVVAKLIYSLPKERFRYVFRIIFMITMVVPGVAVQLIWGSMIYADQGMINELLNMVGLEDWTQGWLSNPNTALLAVAFVGCPWVAGFSVLIYYAGLSSIPVSVNEAAKLEGCVGIRKFFVIDVPMVMSQLKLILILTIIGGVQAYENILILTNGGPGFKTMVPGYWMYLNAFSFQRMGYACSIGVCLFVIIFGLTMINMRYFRSAEEMKGE